MGMILLLATAFLCDVTELAFDQRPSNFPQCDTVGFMQSLTTRCKSIEGNAYSLRHLFHYLFISVGTNA